MRLAVLKSNLTRMTPILLAALLLLALAAFSGAPSTKKTTSDQTTFGSKIQGENEISEVDPSPPKIVGEDQKADDNQVSSSTSVHVSVNSNTTNGETTGSATAEVTQNGETKTFTKEFDGNDISIKIDEDTDFDIDEDNGSFRVRFDSNSKNKTSIKQDVRIEQESD